MPRRSADPKAELIAKAAARASGKKGTGAPPKESAEQFLKQYYRHVAFEDLSERSETDLWGAAVSHYRLAASRLPGVASVRVFTPTVAEHGWSAAGHTVVEVVTDDMPFLVDSVTMELHAENRGVHLVVHPQLLVRRTMTGELTEVIDDESYVVGGEHDVRRESWMHVEVDRDNDHAQIETTVERLRGVLSDVRESVEDWDKMRQQVLDVVSKLEQSPPPSIPEQEVAQGVDLLSWLADDHFTFLGYREYRLGEVDGEDVLRAVPGTGLGILRADQPAGDHGKMPALVRERAREKTLLLLTKANSTSTVHRPVHLDYIGVKTFDESGEVVGERRFLGLYSSAAYTESLTRIPLLREKAYGVLEAAGVERESHTGKALMDVLENYPRDELFQTPAEELQRIAMEVLQTRERRRVRLFVRLDPYHRFLSCLVYLPRDRYNTSVRERISEILLAELGGTSIEYTARVSESMLARVHFVVRPDKGETIDSDVDLADVEKKLAEAARSWTDDFVAAVREEYGESKGPALVRRYSDAWPEAYKEDYSPKTGAADIGELESIEGEEGIGLSFYRPTDCGEREARLKIYRIGGPLSLSNVLPILASMGVEVVDEWPYTLEGLDRETHIYDFGLRHTRPVPWEARQLVQDALAAVWDARNEADGFNALVIDAGLDWRQVTVLRAYAKYMRQGRTPFAQDYIESALLQNAEITRHLLDLFESRFDPDFAGDREQAAQQVEEQLGKALDAVVSLDQDRILRSYLTAIKATLRTNFYQGDEEGRPKPYLSIKLDPSAIPDLPEPRPKYEIFVYSPRVEGVHLRFGDVARGGLRWSDRRDDFRTEVLGLVKAQMVKNTVIVPVGAKGGFFPKQLPDPSEDREAWMEEGKACYRTFISGLLDITDNLVDGEARPPERVVRHDGDDTYLVVAADKGTATFSDIANGIAKDYGFWLGDAFASGGSVGYDHKAMGITARGAWESVKRHFREMGVDCQSEDFTCVGVGDMSGDVFGNGMLLSRHTRLVAAFDHRDIFVDPDPDPEASYEERRRLFEQPRSSWQDYDESTISAGGGVWPRTSKKIPVSDEMRSALSIEGDQQSMTPQELIRAILLSDVDLLWNGGIGTYVKAGSETHADAGDKANDGIRVDGAQLRVRVVGEGGNLGLTQLGRIEYAREGCGGSGGQDQHRLHRQLGRGGHLRPRGQHQDPAGPGGPRRRPHREAAQQAAAGDDRRRHRAGAHRQLRAERRAVDGHDAGRRAGPRARGLDAAPGARWLPRPGAGVPARQRGDGRAHRRRRGPVGAGAGGAAGLHQDRDRRRAARHRPAGRPLPEQRPEGVLPRGDARALRRAGRGPPAASRDRGDQRGQRADQRRGDHLLPPALQRGRRDGGRAGDGQLRCPRHLRVASLRRHRLRLRQPDRRRHPAHHAAADAHAGRAGHALVAAQPSRADRRGRHGEALPRHGDRPDGAAARSGVRAAARAVRAAARRDAGRRRAAGAGRAGRDPAAEHPAAGAGRHRTARRLRPATGAADPPAAGGAAAPGLAQRADPRPAAAGPLADHGPRRAA